MCVYRCEGVMDGGIERDRATEDGGTGGSDMRMCVCVCKCKGVMEGEREKVHARETRQVRGSGGGRAIEAGCEGLSEGGNGMCVCVRVRGSGGGRASKGACEGGSDLCVCIGARE